MHQQMLNMTLDLWSQANETFKKQKLIKFVDLVLLFLGRKELKKPNTMHDSALNN